METGPLAHLPSGWFNANAAWLVLAAIAFNFTRGAGTLASLVHTHAMTATIRRQRINVLARPGRSAQRFICAERLAVLGHRLAGPLHSAP